MGRPSANRFKKAGRRSRSKPGQKSLEVYCWQGKSQAGLRMAKGINKMNNQNQEKSPVTWLRCFSKKKRKIYYFNTKTREAFWDGPDGIEIRDHESILVENNGDIIDDEVLRKINSAKSAPKNKSENTIMSPQYQPEFDQNYKSKQIVSPGQVQDSLLNQESSHAEEDLNDAILQKLYTPKQTAQNISKSSLPNVQDRPSTHKNSYAEEDSNQEVVRKLYPPKQIVQNMTNSSLPQVQNRPPTHKNIYAGQDLDDEVLEKLYELPKRAAQSMAKSSLPQVQESTSTQENSCVEEDLDDEVLQKLYELPKRAAQGMAKSSLPQVQESTSTQENSCVEKDLDDEVLEKLYELPKQEAQNMPKSSLLQDQDKVPTQKNSHAREELDDEVLQKLYVPKEAARDVVKSSLPQVQNRLPNQKNSHAEEYSNQEAMQKLYAPKQAAQDMANVAQPALKHNRLFDSLQHRENLKRKSGDCGFTQLDHTNKRLTEVSNELITLVGQEDSVSRVQSRMSSPLTYSEHKHLMGTSKTPIQDRFDKAKEDLLKQQRSKCVQTNDQYLAIGNRPIAKSTSRSSLELAATNQVGISSPLKYSQLKHLTGRSNTPIQDRFDKAKEDLLKNQKQRSKCVQTNDTPIGNQPIAKCTSRPSLEVATTNKFECVQTNDAPIGNQPIVKCTSRPSLEVATTNKFDVRNGSSESSTLSVHERLGWRKPILKQTSLTNEMPENSAVHVGLKRKSSSTEGGDERQNNPSGVSVKKRISFGELKRNSLESATLTKKQNTLGEVKRYSLESGTTVRKPITFGEVQNSSLESGTLNKKSITFGIKRSSSSVTLDSNSSVDESKPFDLRMKLKQVRRDPNDNAQSSASCQMDWEPSVSNVVDSPHVNNIVTKEKSPVEERHSSFKNIYLVCDTSALLNDYIFVEKLIINGSYLGLPLTITIPYVVFDELDQLKVKDDVGHKARQISRIIQSNTGSKNLLVQEGGKKRDAVGCLELKVNDDLVLNCCLQIRETCSENDLAVLMTTDINLGNKATSFKIQSYNWNSFKRWARGFREYKQPSPSQNPRQVKIKDNNLREEMEMDVDINVTNSENNVKISDYSYSMSKDNFIIENYNKLPEATDPKNSQLQNCIHSHLEELKSDFQTFLHNVIEEAVEKEHGHLKKFTNNIRPSWTLLDYIIEVRQRWFLITSSMLSINVQEIIAKIIGLIKKYNSGKEDFKVVDVSNYFELCATLGGMISKYFPKHGRFFLERLNVLWGEWKEAHTSLSSTNIPQNMMEEDVQPVDVALQNIYNYLHSYYDNLKTQVENNECDQEFEERLSVLYSKISNVESVIKNVFKETPVTLTCNNKKVVEFHESITYFSGVKGSPFAFDIVIENVIEFFQDTSYRKLIRQVIYNLGHLKNLVDKLNRTCR